MKICNLQVGDVVIGNNKYLDRYHEYKVVTNNIGDVLFLWSEDKEIGYHIFYDNEKDLEFAKFKFGLDI